jgi:hypothetical protein
MTTRQASCRCGQLRLTATGEAVRISVCHCLACQQRTGSTYGAQARFPAANIAVEGRSTEYVRTADSGNKITYFFCPVCGSTVHYYLNHLPEVIAVPVGAFADPEFPAPWASVHESRRHAWVGLPDDIEHVD